MSATATPQTDAPRIMAGLQSGRVVNYVMANGAIRPLVVVEPWDGTGTHVNGVLLFDGSNDKGNFAHLLCHIPADISEADLEDLQNAQRAYHPESQGVKQRCTEWITSAPYSEDAKPGTWHWPKRDAIMAASVDPAALQTQLETLVASEVQAAKTDLLQLCNQKIQGLADTMQDALDAANVKIADLTTQVAASKPAEIQDLSPKPAEASPEVAANTAASVPAPDVAGPSTT